MKLIFTHTAEKQFKKLSTEVQDYLKSKIREYQRKEALFEKHLKARQNLEPATHRLKVGNYRFLLELEIEPSTHRVLKVGHRKNVYK